MSFFDGFIQGAAESASGILDQQIQNDSMLNRQKAIADYNEQLEEKKLRAKQQLQQELGQKINDGADLTNRQRIADKINADNGSSMSAEDATEIAKNPNAAKAYGIIDRTRAQELDDKASAADKIGAVDQAKMIRDQQNVEVRRAAEERTQNLGEERNRLTQAQIDSKEQLAKAEGERKDKDSERRDAAFWGRTEALIAKRERGGDLSEGDRKTYTAAMQDATRSIATESARLKNAYSDEEKKAINDHIADLRKEHDTFRQLLIGSRSDSRSSDDKVSTEKPSAYSESSANDSDRVGIIKGEMRKTEERIKSASDPAEKRRSEQDLVALNNELSLLTKSNSGKSSKQPGQSEKPAAKRPPLDSFKK